MTKRSKRPSQQGGKGLRPPLYSEAAPVNQAAPLENITNFQTVCVITLASLMTWGQRDTEYLKGKLKN